MAEIQAFNGVRYNLGRVGSLSEVTSPPYDVISPEFLDKLYAQHPNNFVRIDFNKIEPGDDDASNNRYTRAQKFLKSWLADGILSSEGEPAIYVYYQDYDYAGRTYTRRGFMARHRISRFGEGQVFPHEETMPGPKADRLMLMHVTKMNLSPIFGLYPDAENATGALLDAAVADKTPVVAVDHLGVKHRLWAITDATTISTLTGLMGPKPLFIADGHHRYETACKYRDEIGDTGVSPTTHPSNFVMMMYVAMEDPGLIVLPTHRLFKGLPEMTAEELAAKLGDCFTCRIAGEGADAAPSVWEEIETLDAQGLIGLYTKKDGRWTLAELTEAGKAKMAEAAKEHNAEWQSLGVALLHRLLIGELLGGKDLPKPGYVHLVEEVVEGLKTGEYPLAALVMPATVEHVRQISLQGERMPAKSTYFYPKLLSGLVMNPLE